MEAHRVQSSNNWFSSYLIISFLIAIFYFYFRLFADDSSLFCKFSNNDSIHQTITNQLKPVSNWIISNKIHVNSEKWKFVIFLYTNKSIDIPPIPTVWIWINITWQQHKILRTYTNSKYNFFWPYIINSN